MLVADLHHFLDLGPATPGPARKLGEHLVIYDLRLIGLTAAQPVHDIIIDTETAAILRTLTFLDNDCQRAVFAIQAHNNKLHLALTDDELDELIGALAAEANHEPNRRRQRQLDTAYDALAAATDQPYW